jgi:beta-glucuronidase
MLRRFNEHDLRPVTDLRGIWDFAYLGDIDPETVDPKAIQFDDVMAVPGSFDCTPRYAGRRGLVAYRTRVQVTDEAQYRLVIDGLHHWGRVFVNGLKCCDHAGGFTRFSVDVKNLAPGSAEIVILADNRINYERCPLHLGYYDWYHHGGVTRGVELHRLGSLWIESLRIVTLDYAKRKLQVTFDYATTHAGGEAPLTLYVGGRVVHREMLRVVRMRERIERTVELPDTELWSPEAPHLHLLHARLGDDDLRERFGIRQVRVDGQNILINDQPVKLLGYNRHELHPLFGHGSADQCLVQDIQLLKGLNCNFVRGSHYPQDRRFLDLCDEAGLCVWSEAIGWQNTAEHLNDPRFIDAQRTHMDEMVSDAFNHPCVILWGLLNEGQSHDENCRKGYEDLSKHLRGLDTTRLLTFASNHPYDDKCFDLADVISLNLYPGWYGQEIEEVPAALDKAIGHVDANGQAHKPLIISEIGAEGLYGWRDWNEDRWSEQYQSRLVETVIRHLFIDRQRACGLSLWLFNDFRSMEQPRPAVGRGRGYNNKGVVDEYRRPKLSYDVVKKMFGELK